MKIIEAMKKVKANKIKIADLQIKVAQNSAFLNYETPPYGKDGTAAQLREWLQAIHDLGRDNIALLLRIQATNLLTDVTIELGGKQVTNSIAHWVWRRREYAKMDCDAWSKLTDRNLKEGYMPSTIANQPPEKVTLVRYYEPSERDTKVAEFREEPSRIDAALEIVNAVTDLVEAREHLA